MIVGDGFKLSWEIRNPVLFVAIPHTGTVSMEWALSFKQLNLPAHLISLSRGTPWDVARNTLVKEFLDGPATYLLFLDTDVVVPAHGINELLSTDLPIVSGLYYTKTPPNPVPAMWRRTEEEGVYAPVQNFNLGDMVEALRS